MATAEETLDTRISIRAMLKEFWASLLAAATFTARRLAFAAATLLIIIFLSYFGLDMARGSDFLMAVGHGASGTARYLGRLASGNLGTAFAADFGARRTGIAQILQQTVPRSLGLLAVSLGVASVVGAFLGALAARRKHPVQALPIVLLSLVGISLPSFFTALLLQMGAIAWTRRTGSSLLPVGGFGWDAHLILPALVLAARPIAQITRVTNVTLTRILKEDYVRTARSKGLGGGLVWLRHVWPNVAIPVLTTIGASLRFSLSSLPVVELYFGWPGIGLVLLRAIARRDDLLTVALALTLGLVFITINFLLEAAYRLLDPQLRDNAPARAARSQEMAGGVADAAASLLYTLRELPLLRIWLSPKTAADREYEQELRSRLRSRPRQAELDAGIRRQRAKTWLRGTLGNLPFMAGALMLAGLLVVYVAGPAMSPANPFTTTGISKINDVITVPPFPPSPEYAWGSDALGRDIQSLVLSGAQQTLTVVGLVMLARLAVGFVLGALAGWQQDRALDRLIMAAAEVFSALPTLIFAMILILALGIRRGIWVFVVALCFVGWGEMMQFIRSEVIVIRTRLYVESAVASGARLSGIIVRHMLPNLLPALIALAALEMGAVAMLLGELGFIGIFIGGGAFSDVIIGGPPYHYSDIPEWGALLSNVRAF
ncbi:MAG: ABC transporter permease subunit, partial [Anaerolineae bacterium]